MSMSTPFGNDANDARYVNTGYFKPMSTSEEKLTVSSSAVGFSNWPSSGQVLLMFTVETADVYFSLGTTATSSSQIMRVGDSFMLELDAASATPSFLRVGSTDGEVRAQFLERA